MERSHGNGCGVIEGEAVAPQHNPRKEGVVEIEKTCSKCKQAKTLDNFARAPRYKYGVSGWCKQCTNEYHREYTRNNRDKVFERGRKWREANPDHYLKQTYKMSREQYNEMLERQGNRCAICRSSEPGGKNWHVDHDHSCCPGRYTCGDCTRGLLCKECNTKIVDVAENKMHLLEKALEYLEAHKSCSA